ncbi:MAG: DUF1559 domain-containing protein [Planctomycetia bacterium]|nr:DUF1559 domain-containing protein [Planctomycetia bacterium]
MFALLATLTGLVLAGVQRVRASAARTQCANNLKQIGLALHQYHDTHRAFPAGLRTQNDPYPYLSWLARLLPMLEQQSLWELTQREYARDNRFWMEPRHSPGAIPVSAFVCPADGRGSATVREGYQVAFTHYLGVSGATPTRDDGVLYYDSAVRIVDITDGTSQTVACGERPPSPDYRLGWWYAGVGQNRDGDGDMILSAIGVRVTFRAPTCPFGPYQFGPGDPENLCDAFHFWSRHSGGAHFLFAGGSVRFLRYDAANILPALATRAGGEAVTISE